MFFYTFMPKLFNMSLTASVAIVLVILLRLLLKKAPKVISYALWGVVLFRLLCPVSIDSNFSVYNLFDAPAQESGTITSVIEYIPSNIVHTEYPSVALPVPGISDVINDALPQGREQLVADPLEAPMSITTYIWMIGVLVMAIYSIVSYVRLRRKLSVVVPLRDNIFIADDVKSPFVVGLFRPKIYLPCNLGDKEQEYIILHEQHHIKRLDHVMKALAFLALAIHWFNPLVWVAFILASKDMEMSCDEAVIRKIGSDVRADYSASLLTLATGRRIIAGTPLAFGEGDTKGRIRNLANWHKPAFWVVLIAVIACLALAVGLLTNPAAEREFPINGSNVSDLDTEMVVEKIAKAEGLENSSQLLVDADNFDLMFTSDFNWANDGAIRFLYGQNQKYYSAQLRMFHDDNKYFITDRSEWIEPEKIFLLSHYLDALKYMPQEEVRQLSPDADGYSVFMRHEGAPSDYERVLKYSQNGVNSNDGWYIHLEVQPLHEVEGGGYNGTGDEVIHLFYNSGDNRDDIAGKTYLYDGEGFGSSFTITLYEDGTFTYYEGMLSSYIGTGTFMLDGDTVIMTDNGHGGYGLVNHFKRDGDDLVFVEQDSDNFVYVKVKDGEKFHRTGEAFKQNNGADGTTQIMPSQKLSLNDVIMLSQKGYDLTWSDFDDYTYIETGSGLYIRVYEINEMYELWIGGGGPDSDPMYIYLALANDLDTRIDIRDGGVTEFISEYGNLAPTYHPEGILHLGLNAEIVEIDASNHILYVKDIDESADVFGDRCAIDCNYAISRFNLLYVNYGDANDVRTIGFSDFQVGDAVIIGLYDSEKQNALNGAAVAEQIQLGTQRMNQSSTANMTNDEGPDLQYYLTIGAEGVKSIELSMPHSSGGCENADGSLFKKGERVWLENLDGYSDLRGLTITALGKNGEIIWTASIPNTAENNGFTHLTQDDWVITNIE